MLPLKVLAYFLSFLQTSRPRRKKKKKGKKAG